ncbi:hypothetical protein NA57DRAFT_48353 [Rhizodiscina lignyota]|uniref:Wax synthase domain-containing protein n=1 Tax=Rhizodiscina lignyota TaxID=1504668 RepID=A0A9P4M535_9PEZI|nr:hypothetical protein NA57DRAFT_48353 [Rhizodiscina lignyota]
MLKYTPLAERYAVNGAFATLVVPLCYILISLCAAFRPSASRTVLTGSAIIAITFLLYNIRIDAPYAEIYAGLTCWGIYLFHWCDRILLASQDHEKWHDVPTTDGPAKRPPRQLEFGPPEGFLKRLKWSWSHTIATRGFGKSWQVKKVPPAPPPGTGRWTFVVAHLLRFFIFMTIADLGKIWAANTALTGYHYWEDAESAKASGDPVFFSLSLMERVQCCWLLICVAYWTLTFISSLLYAVTVALGIWKSEDCPPPFGDLKHLYTVRNAWSIVWHQCLRRIATVPGTLVAKRWLKLKPGTFASKYSQLFIGFAVTGAAHSIGSLLIWGRDTGEIPFWMAQATAIMIEDHVVSFGKQLGLKDSEFWRFAGFVWVGVWFSWSPQTLFGNSVEDGFLISRRPPDMFGFDAWLKMRRGVVQT